jgi:hypothetical protein
MLYAPFAFRSKVLNRAITIPAGFMYDGASVPRYVPFAYAIFGGRSEEAACAHDYLYSSESPCTRKQADDTYLELMEVTGAKPFLRLPMWAGVRCFGWLHFKGTKR